MKTPYKDLLPPLSTEEYDALESDIRENGVLNPILVDEDGNILDGHHRYKISPNADTRVIRGLAEEEKVAFAIRCNMTRRNLSPDRKTGVKRVAEETRKVKAEANRKAARDAMKRNEPGNATRDKKTYPVSDQFIPFLRVLLEMDEYVEMNFGSDFAAMIQSEGWDPMENEYLVVFIESYADVLSKWKKMCPAIEID